MLLLQPGHPGTDNPYTPPAYAVMTMGAIVTQLQLVYESLGFQMLRDAVPPAIGLAGPAGPNVIIMGRQI